MVGDMACEHSVPDFKSIPFDSRDSDHNELLLNE
jgi:hypothetical protein